MKNKWLKTMLLGAAVVGMAASSQGLRADDETGTDSTEELRTMLGNVTAQLNSLQEKSDKMPTINFNADLRYDQQYFNKGTIAASNLANPLVTFPTVPGSPGFNYPNGATGMYAKRVEVYFKENLAPDVKAAFQYEFAGNKLEEVFVEFDNLTLLPYTDIPGWTYNLIVGQMRQHFGIENQTGSSSIYFSERAMMYGGANPLGASKLVAERVMGIHLTHKKDLGFLTYDLGADISNDALNDQAVGQTSLATAFPAQANDQDPSEIGRLGIEPTILNKMLPLDMKFKFGGSAIHDSQNSVYYAVSNVAKAEADTVGADATFEMMKEAVKIQSEYLSKETFTGTAAPGGFPGMKSHAEAWYATLSVQPLKFFIADAPKVELLGRYESYVPNVDSVTVLNTKYPLSANANTIGLKYTYLGNNQTSINYTTYGLNGDFSVMGATELLTIQQQINF